MRGGVLRGARTEEGCESGGEVEHQRQQLEQELAAMAFMAEAYATEVNVSDQHRKTRGER